MTELWTESAMRVRLRDSRTIHATRLSAERRVWTACGRPYAVTATVESLIRRGQLETGEFAGLGVPRLAVVTAAGRALLDTPNPEGH